MGIFTGKTAFITGGSRGIGKAIGLKLAKEGANVVIAAKTATPHPKLEGTIHTTVKEIIAAGGRGLALQMDVRFEDRVQMALDRAAEHFGGIDILVNNASAISLTSTEYTEMKRYDLMHAVNVRGTFLTSKLAIPFLKKSENAHILNLSPPLNMKPKWFMNHCAYSMSKYGMSMCVLGMAAEFAEDNIAVNALWPQTTIATAAVKNLLGGDDMIQRSRTPEIVADAASIILARNSTTCTGHFYLDVEVLKEEGIKAFDQYAVNPDSDLQSDLFL